MPADMGGERIAAHTGFYNAATTQQCLRPLRMFIEARFITYSAIHRWLNSYVTRAEPEGEPPEYTTHASSDIEMLSRDVNCHPSR